MIFDSAWGPIHYDVAGPEGAPVVAFTHGIVLDHTTFEAQVAGLSDAYRVLVWDLPGHGRSYPLQGTEFRFSVSAACLFGVLNAIGADRAVLVGQSLGSLVSQYAAHTHPQRATALVHVGGMPLAGGMSRLAAAVWGNLLKTAVLIPEGAFCRWFARERAVTAEARGYMERSAAKMGRQQVLDLTQAYLRDFAAGIPSEPQMPSLIAVGEHEVGMVRKAASRWHANARNSRLEVIPGAGHIANHDQPDAFNLVLASFLEELRLDETSPTAAEESGAQPA